MFFHSNLFQASLQFLEFSFNQPENPELERPVLLQHTGNLQKFTIVNSSYLKYSYREHIY